MYLISAYKDAEQAIGRKADKNRKIYNGMMKAYFYQYMGPRPSGRRNEQTERDKPEKVDQAMRVKCGKYGQFLPNPAGRFSL